MGGRFQIGSFQLQGVWKFPNIRPMSRNVTSAYSAFTAEVEAFLAETGTSKTALGKEALGDPGFVDGLRNGRRPRLDTVQRVRDFIDEQGAG